MGINFSKDDGVGGVDAGCVGRSGTQGTPYLCWCVSSEVDGWIDPTCSESMTSSVFLFFVF
jgi:hypothetical protein